MKVVASILGMAILALATHPCPAGDTGKVRRFDVVAVGDVAILVDTVTGDTWLLTKSPSSDNRSGHVWEKIPAPWGELSPALISRPKPVGPPFKPDTTVGDLAIKANAPHNLPIGKSHLFVLDVTTKSHRILSEVRVRLPESLAPVQASAGYKREEGNLVWSNVNVSPETITRFGVMAEASQVDKEATISWTVTDRDAAPLATKSVVAITPDSASEGALPSNDAGEKAEEPDQKTE